MNVIITLDSFSVRMIEQGFMKVIPRGYSPMHFNVISDCIYILEARTKRFALVCKVSKFVNSSDITNIWREYGREMGFKREWVSTRLKAECNVILWVIMSVSKVDKPIRFDSVFDIRQPPHNCKFVMISPENIVKQSHVSFTLLWKRIEVIGNAVQ